MQSFELFVKSLQSAIVNSSEAIRKRNESILDEYFFKETSEIILENKEYNKELFTLIQPIRSNDIFIEYVSNENLNIVGETNLKQGILYSVKPDISKEDVLLADFLLESFTFCKNNNLLKIIKEQNTKELIQSKLYNSTLFENIKKDSESKEITFNEIKIKKKNYIDLENELRILETKRNEFFDKKQNVISEMGVHHEQLKKLDLSLNELKKIEAKLLSFNKGIDKISNELVNIEAEVNQKKINLDNEKFSIDQLEIKLQGLIQSISNSEQAQNLYINNLFKLIQDGSNLVKLIKNTKIDKEAIIELIKNSKRYIKKNIESLVPKTVRVNYPATFDYATPDNEKEYKTISTPVEVPLLTLVPISNYNIEKATFNANFKFDVVDEQVMIDFSKDIIKENEVSNNYGKLEIVLSPQQTPEGLRSLIESYENFLKRQIT
ncbi:DUF2589 domain-containing protein [Flavobacterium sp. I3-2]|uniref:DUF2589 domain-containing protein n=1 Tax=Flavobacterium sp. I3-2 TaxID=2748319 RepID=UPI0015B324A1|nr:DUF2589 domain-containing protein [Flavobacterium sp. I3-2]